MAFPGELPHVDGFAAFCSIQKWPSASVKDRRPKCPSRSVQVSMSFSFGIPSVSPSVLIENGFVSIRHLGRIIAVVRVADRTGRTSTAAVTGIVTGAHVSPRLGFMVLADPTRSAADSAFRCHYFSFSRYWGLGSSSLPCGARAIFGDYAKVGVSIISGRR
jgi:hypothetical protein